jgi:hypothetical protein
MRMTPNWEAIYEDAVLETDSSRLGYRIDSAVVVLCGRLLELGFQPEHVGERHRIVDALQTLHMIRRTELDVRFQDRGSRTVN